MSFKSGDRVFQRDDPRHIGIVEGLTHTDNVKVRWEDNGIVSYIPVQDRLLVKLKALICGCMTNGDVVCLQHELQTLARRKRNIDRV